MAIFDSGLSNVSILIDVPFPSNVVSGPGVEVNKTNAVWSVQLDFPDLVENTSLTTPSSYYLAMWDTALARYEKVRADNFIAGTTGLDQRSPIGDANYSVLISDRYVGLTAALTAVRTITLPASSTVPPGRLVTIQDEVGGLSDTAWHSVVPTGADTINGGAAWINKTRYGAVTFRANGSNAWNLDVLWQRSPVADAAYTATQGDAVIAYTSLSAARTVTLPAASAYPRGQRLTVIDESGSCSATNTITVNRAGADTINGATSQVISLAYGYLALESDGASRWTIVDSATVPVGQLSGVLGGAQGGTGLTEAPPMNCGVLSLSTNISFNFKPKNGDLIKIAGQLYQIPSGGITGTTITSMFKEGVAAQALSASTFYYLYCFNNGGVLTADASTTGYIIDTTVGNVGVAIKAGFTTRTLIGAIYVDASGHLNDADASRTLISWFNRQPKRLQNAFTATRSTTSTSLVEVNSEIRCNFIIWADDALKIAFNGYAANATANDAVLSAIGIDGTTIGATTISLFTTAGFGQPIAVSEVRTGISEGAIHYATAIGAVSAGTGNWQKATSITGEAEPTLSGFING